MHNQGLFRYRHSGKLCIYRKKTMTNNKNILKAIKPTKMFYAQMGKYPDIWIIRAVNNISQKEAKEVLKLAKQKQWI